VAEMTTVRMSMFPERREVRVDELPLLRQQGLLVEPAAPADPEPETPPTGRRAASNKE
jgi:hypothetical protein